jgi:2'-5' RNA ligase
LLKAFMKDSRKLCWAIPVSETIRSFIAFDLDNESILKKITNLQLSLAKTGADLKLVEPKNIHITLRFLGNITPNMIDRIFEEMKKVQFTPFNANLHGVGVFPNLHYPRVLWVGITDGAEQLRGIFEQLEPRLRSLGFAPDSKGFSPHLTIARVRSGSNKAEIARSVSENAEYTFGIVKADCLRLKKSELTPKGPIYSTLREVCPQRQNEG